MDEMGGMVERAYIIVTAGVILGESEPEYSRSWRYSAADAAADEAEGKRTILLRRYARAQDYAQSLLDPSRVNWVRLDWVWL